MQKELEDISNEKPKIAEIKIAHISTDFQKILALPDWKLNLFNNTPYFLKGILSKKFYTKIYNYFSFKLIVDGV